MFSLDSMVFIGILFTALNVIDKRRAQNWSLRDRDQKKK